MLHDVVLFEVALRNTYDRCLSASLPGDWLLGPESPVRRPILRTNRRGNVRVQNLINRKTIDALDAGGRSHDWIVSNLTLGFWAHMTDRSHERDLWIPHLHSVWPTGASRADIATRIATVNGARNRAVHHEHLSNPARSGISVALASTYMAGMFPHLVPQEFRDAFPGVQPTAVDSLLSDDPAPFGVFL